MVELIEKERSYSVVKSNELIQKSRFTLSLVEQKTVAYICSLIKPLNNGYQLEYVFDIREYAKICGIDYNNGGNYEYIKRNLKRLRDRSMWIEMGDEEVLVGWLSKVRTNKRSGKVTIKIDEEIAPFLFDLKEKFTQYELYNILSMKSAFSMRIYELLKSYQNLRKKKFSIDDLKCKLMVQDIKSYDNFKDFRKKVIEVAVKEINELTDIHIDWEPEKKGRKVVAIIFRIEQKNTMEYLKCRSRAYERLEKIS